MMSAQDVVAAMQSLEAAGVPTWLDGGWAVDAALGRQTRAHDDLDLVLALEQTDAACAALLPLGYHMHTDERPTRFVLRDAQDRRIDVHTVTFDAHGNGVQRLPDGRAFSYPPDGFTGLGHVAGSALRCLTPEVQLLCHAGYAPDEQDQHDVRLLCEEFSLPLPEPYRS